MSEVPPLPYDRAKKATSSKKDTGLTFSELVDRRFGVVENATNRSGYRQRLLTVTKTEIGKKKL